MKRIEDEYRNLLPQYQDEAGVWRYCDTPFEDLNHQPLTPHDMIRMDQNLASGKWALVDLPDGPSKRWGWLGEDDDSGLGDGGTLR